MSDELIAFLCEDLTPIRRTTMSRRLVILLGAGVLTSFLLMLFALGLRPDLTQAAGTLAFWLKLIFSSLMAGLGAFGVYGLGRPGGSAIVPATAALTCVVSLIGAACLYFQSTGGAFAPGSGRAGLSCVGSILILSLPIFWVAMSFLRSTAPTNQSFAGGMAGLAASGLAAFIYALHCPYDGLSFLSVWIVLPIALATMSGALLGRMFLRW